MISRVHATLEPVQSENGEGIFFRLTLFVPRTYNYIRLEQNIIKSNT